MDSNGKLRIGVIFGGRSGEHEVSLMSARSVLNALDPAKYQVTQIGITHEGVWLIGDGALDAFVDERKDELDFATLLPEPRQGRLYSIHVGPEGELLEQISTLDVVFPVLHGTFGEDGALQGLCELADLAYVGAGVLGSSLGMDKGVFKDVMRANGLPVLDFVVVSRKEVYEDIDNTIEQAMSVASFPLFTKPANLGSSVGITKCTSRSDLMEGLAEAARYDRRVLVERGISAREIEVSVLGNENPEASIPGEIIPSREFYSYEAKYIDDASELLIPAPISRDLTERAMKMAVDAYRAIDCAGMARVDFLLDNGALAKGREPVLYLNELNTIPGFTKISMYPKLWEASGLQYSSLIDRLVELAMERKFERDSTERRYRRGG